MAKSSTDTDMKTFKIRDMGNFNESTQTLVKPGQVAYSIDLKIVAFPCERDFYFFEIIRLVIFVEPFNSSQKARIHTFSSSKS